MSRLVVIALLTGLVASMPVLYLCAVWPTVPELVPIHFGANGIPDHFTSRQWLWNIVWWPALAFIVLTFLPQVHSGQSLFWSSYQQRQLRWLLVGGGTLFLLILMHHCIKSGKSLPRHLGSTMESSLYKRPVVGSDRPFV